MVLAQLALRLARTKGKISQDEIDELDLKMQEVPDVVEKVLERHGESIKDLVDKYVDKGLFVFLGRGTEAGPIWAAADVAVDATPWASWSRAALLAIGGELPTVKMQAGVGGWSEQLEETLPMVSGNPERFAGDLVRLASDRALRREILEHGAKVSEEIDVGNVVERLGTLYRSLVIAH